MCDDAFSCLFACSWLAAPFAFRKPPSPSCPMPFHDPEVYALYDVFLHIFVFRLCFLFFLAARRKEGKGRRRA